MGKPEKKRKRKRKRKKLTWAAGLHFGPFGQLFHTAHLFFHAVDHFHVGPTGRIPPARAAPAFSSLFGGTGLSVIHLLPSWDPHPSCIFILISANRFFPFSRVCCNSSRPPGIHGVARPLAILECMRARSQPYWLFSGRNRENSSSFFPLA